jgi:hypothetical protein
LNARLDLLFPTHRPIGRMVKSVCIRRVHSTRWTADAGRFMIDLRLRAPRDPLEPDRRQVGESVQTRVIRTHS